MGVLRLGAYPGPQKPPKALCPQLAGSFSQAHGLYTLPFPEGKEQAPPPLPSPALSLGTQDKQEAPFVSSWPPPVLRIITLCQPKLY